MLENLEVKDWLQMNAKLQQKKNKLRQALAQKGILARAGDNKFDHYKYFSEAQYKLLFTELFGMTGLELKFDELEYSTFDGPEKQANGRMPRLIFTLFDVETGFYETTTITGEGIDKGDKAGYKAYTGALKYYLANTFMVATGDDPEVESPDVKMNNRQPERRQQKTPQTVPQQAPQELPVKPVASLTFIPVPVESGPPYGGKSLGKMWNEQREGKNTSFDDLRKAGDAETKKHIAMIDAYVAAMGGKA